MSNWSDDRLDKRDEEVKEGFAEVRAEVREGFARLEAQIKESAATSDERIIRLEAQILANRQEANEGFAEMRMAHTALIRALLVGALALVAALIGIPH